jgi:hypothetical protein
VKRALALRAASDAAVLDTGSAAAALAALLLLLACGKGGGTSSGGWLPGDSLSRKPRGAPVMPAETTNDRAAAGSAVPSDARGGGAASCGSDSVDPGRLDLHAEWRGDHLHVTGEVSGGSGKSLNLSLSQSGKFVYDEVFRGERLATVRLASDRVEVVSVAYAPTDAERTAFARTGAVRLDAARPVCVKATLYDGLNLLAARQLAIEPRH